MPDAQDYDGQSPLSPESSQCAVVLVDQTSSGLMFTEKGSIVTPASPMPNLPKPSHSIKTEFTTLYPSHWPEIIDLESLPHFEGSDVHHLRPSITQEGTSNPHPKLIGLDRDSFPSSSLSQVHNHTFNSPGELSSKIFPWTPWTHTELNSTHQARYDPLSTLSVPSLSSSGISSVRSNADETCLTPGAFTSTSRLPRVARHYDLQSTRVYESGHLKSIYTEAKPSHTAEEGCSNRKLPKVSAIADTRGNIVDWADWEPSKFQCRFCQERFLVEQDLENHLHTHKRHRRYLKRERKHKNLNPSGSRSLETFAHTVPHNSLAYRKRQGVNNNDTPFPPDAKFSLDDVMGHGKDSQQTPTAQAVTLLLQIQDSKGGDKTLSRLDATKLLKDAQSTYLEEHTDCYISSFQGRQIAGIRNSSVFASSPIPGHASICSGSRSHQVEYPGIWYQRDPDCSGDGIERGGSSNPEDCPDMPIFDLEMDPVEQDSIEIEGLFMVKSLMASVKQRLIACIMDEFLLILRRNRSYNIRSRGNGSGSTPSEAPHSEPINYPQGSSSNRSRQRNREDNDNEGPGDGDDDDQRTPKRPRTISSPIRTFKESLKFACPYRKHDPRKYCVRNWRPCALTALDSVARVKAHLYRHHRIFQCQRCKGLFLNQNILDEHILALQGCEPKRINLAEGITADIEKRLRSRKKTYPNQTEVDRWKEIYLTLFPASAPPSPFFEPVEESVDLPSDSAKLADLEAYTQRELPKLFWAALEEVVANEMQPVEERLRTQLMGMIRDCHDRVFSTYQSMVTSTIDNLLHDNSTRDELLSQFEPLSQTLTAESHLRSNLSLPSLRDTSTANEAKYAGRGSNVSAFNSSTTLSSIINSSTTLSSVFNSTTTLSSIASSQIPPAAQPSSTKSLGAVDEMTTCAFGANDKTMATTGTASEDFWTMDLEESDLSPFDAEGMWNTRAATYENSQ